MTDVEDEAALVSGVNLGPNGLLEAGWTTEIVADIFPARIEPKPAEIPAGVSKMRAIVTGDSLTIAWNGGFQRGVPIVNRFDVLLDDGAENVSFRGGEVQAADETSYTITKGNGCSCGAGSVKSWQPFPNVNLAQRGSNTALKGSTAGRYKRL